MSTYNFKTTPYDHQASALEESWSAKYYALFMEMGTGKSKVAIDTVGRLYCDNKISAALIIAPKGVYDNWYKKELPIHLGVEYHAVRWTPSTSKKFKKELDTILVPNEDKQLRIFVMNVEALSSKRGAQAAYTFLMKNPGNIMIVDESTTIKNRQAQRTKNIVKLGEYADYRRILTGSPITRSPMDLYGQCSFLSTKALGFNSYYAFQGRYAHVQRVSMGPKAFQQITGYQRLDELNAKLDKFSNRVLKKDCLDLPDKIYQRRDVEITDEQAKLYNQMKKLALAQFDSGELATTQSVLTQIMRLQQICCGFLAPDDEPLQELPCNRIKELMSVIEEASGKIIIWCNFTYDIHKIEQELSQKFGDDSVASYYGETPQDERQEIVNRFQDPNSGLRFFVGQPRTGGYGITLTEADTVVYYSNNYDLEIRLQSEDRAHRIGQKKPVNYIDLVVPNTVEEKIIKALRTKINLAEQVLGEEARDWLI